MECQVCFNLLKEPRVVVEGQQEEENQKLEEFRSKIPDYQQISFLSTRPVDDISLTRCGHLCHTQCLQTWCLNEQWNMYTCPGCKKEIKLEEVIHVEPFHTDEKIGHEEDLMTSSSSSSSSTDENTSWNNNSGHPFGTAAVVQVNARAFQQLKEEHELLIFDFLERRKHYLLEQQKLMETNAKIEMASRQRANIQLDMEKTLESFKNLALCQQCSHCTSLLNSQALIPTSKPPAFQPNKLFVGGVDFLEEIRIFDHFSSFGEVVDVQWPINSVTKAKKGYCFVEMSNQLEVRFALTEMFQRIVGSDNRIHVLTVKRAIETGKDVKKPVPKTYCSKIETATGIHSVGNRPPPGFPPIEKFPNNQLQYDDDIFRNFGSNYNWMPSSNPPPSPPLSLTPPAASPSMSIPSPQSWNTYSLFPESDSTEFPYFAASLTATSQMHGNPLYNRK